MKKGNNSVKWVILLLVLLARFPVIAQALEWETFRQQVIENHPLAQIADLSLDQAAYARMRAKGGFDPKIYSDFYTKSFSDKTYFQYTESGVKLPTWAGLEIKGAYNTASGIYLNQESTLPSNGQASLGFTWTLGQGLLMDDRRAGLRQSQIGLQLADAERTILLNELLFEAAKTYWTWVAASNQLNIYEAALRQAQIRHEALRESLIQGDKPAIDTIETYIQVQNWLLDVNFSRVEVQNAALALGNFIWTGKLEPASPDMIPNAPLLSDLQVAPQRVIDQDGIVQEAQRNHPQLRAYLAKLQSLDVERRLKNEKRKPVLDLNYNILGAGWGFFPTVNTDGLGKLANDIKWGLNFSYPILNRKARGDMQITQIKIAQTELDQRQKSKMIEAKVRQYANDLQNLQKQLDLYSSITNNYRVLLDAESEKFRQGESSVFLINAREQKWLETQVKYLKLQAEYKKTEAGLLWASGRY